MKKFVKAKVNWILTRQDGSTRMVIGSDLKYCPLIRFEEEENNESWSSEIISSKLISENTTEIIMSFLSPLAPFELLQINKKFILQEKDILAKGEIIDIYNDKR